jgi:hypothetical protein
MSTKHTPEPWHFYPLRDDRDDGLGYIRCDTDALEIAHHGDANRPREENIANGHLIAAAPDLLKSLRGLLPHVLTGPRDYARDVAHWQSELAAGNGEAPFVLAAYAAIAKAEGQ